MHAQVRRVARRWTLGKALAILAAVGACASILPLLLVTAALGLPAAVLESPVESMTGGRIKLIARAGQVQAGRAELWVRDAASRDWHPWIPFQWTLTANWRDGGHPWPGAIVLETSVGKLSLDRSGLAVTGVRATLLPALLAANVDHPLAQAPWRGDIELTADAFSCSMASVGSGALACEGAAMIRSHGVGSPILPLGELGDYDVAIATQRDSGRIRAEISTRSGVVEVAGFAEAMPGAGRYRITVHADTTLIEGLRNVAGQPASAMRNPNEYVLEGHWQRPGNSSYLR